MRLRLLVAVLICFLFAPEVFAAQQTFRWKNVTVSHPGISPAYVRAIARTTATARAVASKQYGFDMPDTLRVKVQVVPNGKVRLHTNGTDGIFLSIRSERDLQRPQASGIFQLYGLCHEVGHLAMYRTVSDHRWMTGAAAEGWAHYLGSRIVDTVYQIEGPDLWPDRYDYRNDGTARLKRQLASSSPTATARGAAVWAELVAIVGDRGVMPIFQTWGKTPLGPHNPAMVLGKALRKATFKKQPVAFWWNNAAPLFIRSYSKNRFSGSDERKSFEKAPRTSRLRGWIKSDGKSKVYARFAGFENGYLLLKTLDKTIVMVKPEELCSGDQQYVQRLRAAE